MKNIEQFRNKSGQVWLNIASSTQALEGFVNLDNHIFIKITALPSFIKRIVVPKRYREKLNEFNEIRKKSVLIRHDCRKPLPFPPGSIDHALCSHFLEHVFPSEAKKIIDNFYRVLKKEGTLHIIVPDIHGMAEEYIDKRKQGISNAADNLVRKTILSRETRGSFKYRVLEFIGSFGLQHRWMYDKASMSLRLENAGFEILKNNESPSKNFRLNDGSVHILARKN